MTVPILSIICMGISALLAIGLPIGIYIALRKKFALKFTPVLMGAVVFFIAVMVLERLLHAFVLRPDENGVAALTYTPALFVLYAIFAAGIFEETARFLSFLYLKKANKGIGTGLSYGIGHGGMESIILVGFSMINSVIICIMINLGTVGSLETPIAASQIEAIAGTAPYIFLISGIERVFAVAIHISLSLIVWVAVENKKWLLYPAAICLHAAVNLPAALMQIGILKSVVLTELMVGVGAAVVVMLAIYICKGVQKDNGGNIVNAEENPPLN